MAVGIAWAAFEVGSSAADGVAVAKTGYDYFRGHASKTDLGVTIGLAAAALLAPGGGGAAVTRGLGNVGGGVAKVDDALIGAQRWLGEGHNEIAPGVFRSADDSRQFRMTISDLTDPRQGPHVHFEAIADDGREIIESSHVLIRNE